MKRALKHGFVTPLALMVLIPGLVLGSDPPETTQDEAIAEETEESPLPPGHPAMVTKPKVGFDLPPVPEGTGTGERGLSWTTPEGWIEEQPANAMRRAQYRIPAETGDDAGTSDGECVVFYFGPGQGGDPLANAQRWGSQFIQPDGTPASEALVTKQIEINGIPILTSEITGTYGGGMRMGRPGEVKENHMLLGAVAEGPDANWFFKFTGPKATVETNRAAFEALIGSLAVGN